MAENVTITAGTGTTIAADDVGGVKYQQIKLVDGAADSTTPTGTIANPLQVALPTATVTTLTPPAAISGFGTAANQATIIGHVDGIETVLGTIDADTSILAGGVAGGHYQADIVGALPAGTALIGKVSIDQVTANANEVVTKTGSVTAATLSAETTKVIGTVNVASSQTIAVTNATAANLKAELGASTAAIGKLAANSGVDIGDVDILSIAAGDNNIGNVDLASAIPAGTNLVGKISAGNDTTTVYSGATALTPKFAAIAAASSGNNTVIAAVADKKIRVLAAQFMSAGTVNAKWQTAAGGTDLTGLAYLIANTGMVLPYNPVGWFETGVNALLNLNLSGAIAVGGSITYIEV